MVDKVNDALYYCSYLICPPGEKVSLVLVKIIRPLPVWRLGYNGAWSRGNNICHQVALKCVCKLSTNGASSEPSSLQRYSNPACLRTGAITTELPSTTTWHIQLESQYVRQRINYSSINTKFACWSWKRSASSNRDNLLFIHLWYFVQPLCWLLNSVTHMAAMLTSVLLLQWNTQGMSSCDTGIGCMDAFDMFCELGLISNKEVRFHLLIYYMYC